MSVHPIDLKNQTILEFMMKYANDNDLNVVTTINTSQIKRQYARFKKSLPSVEVFYAVKCNPHPAIVETYLSLGASFDCASPAEIKIAVAAGAQPENLLYAHTCKIPVNIIDAYKLGVNKFTFDSEGELTRMLRLQP